MSFAAEFKTLSKLLLDAAIAIEGCRERALGADAWKDAEARQWRKLAEECRKQSKRLERMAAASGLRAP